jgi:hypothetical protein
VTLLDLLVPTKALRWGRLTFEPMDWHIDQLRYAFAETHRAIMVPLEPVIVDLVNVVADAARHFADIFPIVTEHQPVWPEDRP